MGTGTLDQDSSMPRGFRYATILRVGVQGLAMPLVVNWLERASSYTMPHDFEPNIEPRKLSTIYQFVRGMPVLYVETRLRKELEDIKEQLPQRLDHQRKVLLLERQKTIMRMLGRQ